MGRIRWASQGAGAAASGYIAVLTDLVTEGLHQAFYARLPGHPQQAADSLDVTGSDRDLIKYSPSVDFIGDPLVSAALWKTRVHRAWKDYEQGGTPQVVIQGVNDWGNETFGTLNVDLDGYAVALEEYQWARFRVDLSDDVPWGPAFVYGAVGRKYGDGGVYGMSGHSDDIQSCRRTVRKWKPKRSKGKLRFNQGQIIDAVGDPFFIIADPGEEYNLVGSGTLNLQYGLGVDGGDGATPGNIIFVHIASEGLNLVTYELSGAGPNPFILIHSHNNGINLTQSLYYKRVNPEFTGNITVEVTAVGGQRTLAQTCTVSGEYAPASIVDPILEHDETTGQNSAGDLTAALPTISDPDTSDVRALVFLSLNANNTVAFSGAWTEVADAERGAGSADGGIGMSAASCALPAGNSISTELATLGAITDWAAIAVSIIQHEILEIPV